MADLDSRAFSAARLWRHLVELDEVGCTNIAGGARRLISGIEVCGAGVLSARPAPAAVARVSFWVLGLGCGWRRPWSVEEKTSGQSTRAGWPPAAIFAVRRRAPVLPWC